MLDVAAGLVLAVSPFVFGFSDEGANAWVPHVVAGVGLIGAGLLTQRTRETHRRAAAMELTAGVPTPDDARTDAAVAGGSA
jgi:hypothetical protein